MDGRSSLPSPDRDRPLAEVIEDLRGSLRAAEAHEPTDEWFAYEVAFRRLRAWAEGLGVYYPDLQPEYIGGREHDIVLDEASSTWLKFTKPSAAAYQIDFDADAGRFAMRPGLPLEYLERLLLLNDTFGELTTFVGVGGGRGRPRIITRQVDVEGEPATVQEIVHLMVDVLGFSPLPQHLSVGYQSALAFIRDDVAVFDLRPANVVTTPDGIIVPIDAIPACVDAAMRARFAELLGRP